MTPTFFSLTFLLILLTGLLAVDPPSIESGRPPIQEIAPGIYQFGEISINVPKRQISFPVKVNQTEGNLEYVLVNEHGKTHESLFATPVKSMDLQIALLLCHFKMSPDRIFRKRLSKEEQEALPEVKKVPEAQLALSIEWTDPKSGEIKREEVHRWVFNDREKASLKEQSWIFNGLRPPREGEPPLEENSLIAIYLDPFSPVNYDGPDNDNDDLWYPTPEKVPPVEMPLLFHIEAVDSDHP